MLILCLFAAYYFASLGMIYAAPLLGGKGNTMGLILGLSDTTSSIYSGYAASIYGGTPAFKAFAATGAILIPIVYFGRAFLFDGTGIFGLILYYIGSVGWGGAFNLLFIVAENETPPEMLGATFSLGLSLGLLAASLAP
jgi:hypothetical protein